MGWDIHFIKTDTVGHILDKGDGFKAEFVDDGILYLYIEDENTGYRSGMFMNADKERYRDQYLNYMWANYNTAVMWFLFNLYKQFGLLFGELEDYYYLYDYAEDKDELFDLQDYSTCSEMLGWFGDDIDQDDWLRKRLEETTPVYERIYERYRQKS